MIDSTMVRIFFLLFLLPSLSEARICQDVFTVGIQRSRTLTQSYILRNSQFPLHSHLIQTAIAADIILNNLSADSSINFVQVGRALNNMHRKFGVNIRVQIPGETSTGNHRILSMEYLEGVVGMMLNTAYTELVRWGYSFDQMNARKREFWKGVKDFYDLQNVSELSRQYQSELIASAGDSNGLVQIKEKYYALINRAFIDYLNQNLEKGLSAEEREFLSSSELF